MDRLLRVAGDHDGKFVVVGIGEDPDTDIALPAEVMHVSNGQADTRSRLMAAIEQVSRRRGANAYFAPVLFRPDLPTGESGGEADVLWQLAIVSNFDQRQDRATRLQRLPTPSHAESNSQSWMFFDQPYPPDQVKPFLVALAAKTGDECKSVDHPFRVPGSLNWPNRREREKLRRSPTPVRAKLVMLMEPWEKGVALDHLKAVMLAKWGPKAFTPPIAAKISEERMLTALQRVVREASLPTDIPTGREPSPAQAPISADPDNACSAADPELKGTVRPADSPDAADAPAGSDAAPAVDPSNAPKSDVPGRPLRAIGSLMDASRCPRRA